AVAFVGEIVRRAGEGINHSERAAFPFGKKNRRHGKILVVRAAKILARAVGVFERRDLKPCGGRECFGRHQMGAGQSVTMSQRTSVSQRMKSENLSRPFSSR